MGLLDYYKKPLSFSGGDSTGPDTLSSRLARLHSSIPSQGDGSLFAGFPARPSLNTGFDQAVHSPVGSFTGFADDVSQGAASAFGELGRLPSKVSETPFSVGDTALRRFGVDVGKSPAGGVLGGVGDVVNRIGNFVPAVINGKDAAIFKAVGDLPDNTPITNELVREKLGLGTGFFDTLFGPNVGEDTGGVPILGLFGVGNRPKTVREFKDELAKRRFFTNEDGTAVTPEQRLAELRSGKSVYDFGYASINDNSLVDLAGRLTLDPTNALFLVPGGAMAKVGLHGAKQVLNADRLIEAGAVAAKLPRPAIAATALAEGNVRMGTLKGLAELLKQGGAATGRLGAATLKQGLDPRNYLRAAEGTVGAGKVLSRTRSFAKSSLALGATNIALNRLTATLNTALGGDVPILKDIADFTSDVENDRPLSENSAWMLASAIAFPYGETVKTIGKKVGAEKVRIVGRNEFDELAKAAGGREQLLTDFGGEPGLQNALYFADKQIIRERVGDQVIKNIVGAKSLPDAATRVAETEKVLQHLVDDARRDGTITGKDRYAALTDWAKRQGGFVRGIENQPTWQDIASRWRQFQPVQQMLDPVIRGSAQLISGLNDRVLFSESVDNALTALKASAKDGRVPKEAILRTLSDNPTLNAMDRTGYWERFALPDIPAPSLRSVQDKLRRQRAESVPIDEYFSDVVRHEQEAPADLPDPATVFEPRGRKIDRLKDELRATADTNGTILDGEVDNAHRIQRELEDALAEENKVAWVQRSDSLKSAGLDPDKVAATSNAAAKEIASVLGMNGAEIPASLDGAGPKFDQLVRKLDYEVSRLNPSYRVKHSPTQRVIAAIRPDDPDFIRALDARTALGEWLHTDGVFSKLGSFYGSLFGPVKSRDQYAAAKQALYNEFIPLGATPKAVDNWLAKLGDRVKAATLDVMGVRLEVFRGVHAVPATWLLQDAKATLPKAVLAKLDDKAIINKFDRSGSRFYRSVRQGAREGKSFSTVLEGFYRAQQNIPLLSGVRRPVARVVYPLWRFILDPRWLALNAVEGTILSGTKDGVLRASESGNLGRYMAHGGKDISDIEFLPDSGWLFGNRIAKYAAKGVEKRSVQGIEQALNAFGKEAPEMVALRSAMKREADQQLAKGIIDQAQHRKAINASNREIGEYINDFLYRVDKRGVKKAVQKTVDEAADDMLTADERRVLQPLLEKIAERNIELWQDVRKMYVGNPDRSTVERVLNSYWLYWPLSYQVKATKWLADVMLDGSFGHDNGALLAGKYALWQQQHVDRMKNDPRYAAMFNQNRTLWFMAQMVLPIGPEDIGVSLGKVASTAAARAQGQVNDWLGTRIGLFTLSKRADDGLLPTIAWITDFGPSYTAELLQRAGSEPAIQSLPFLGKDQPKPAFSTRDLVLGTNTK